MLTTNNLVSKSGFYQSLRNLLTFPFDYLMVIINITCPEKAFFPSNFPKHFNEAASADWGRLAFGNTLLNFPENQLVTD